MQHIFIEMNETHSSAAIDIDILEQSQACGSDQHYLSMRALCKVPFRDVSLLKQYKIKSSPPHRITPPTENEWFLNTPKSLSSFY